MAKVEWDWVENIPPLPSANPDEKPAHEITNRHWLHVDLVDLPGVGNWDEEGLCDYFVEHECEWIDAGGYWYPSCSLQYEIDAVGSEVFCPDEDYWPTPPFKVEIKHIYNVYRDHWGDYDAESYVEIVE